MTENFPDSEIANIAARLQATRGEASAAYKRGFEEGEHWASKEAEDHHSRSDYVGAAHGR